MQKQAERANLSTAGPRAPGPYLPVPLLKTRHQDIQAPSEEARPPVGVAQHGHMVVRDSAPPPCSRPLSSQKHPRITTRGFLGHLCILETAVIERGEKVQTVETVCMTVGCSTNYRRPEVFDT